MKASPLPAADPPRHRSFAGSAGIAVSLLAWLGLGACGDQPQEEAPPAPPAAPLGLQPWHQDFPLEVKLAPRRAGRVYDRSRRQALESLVAKLQGNTSKAAWDMAKEFFWRAPEDAIEPLIEAMDRAYQQPALAPMVQNTVEAMGKMSDERFDEAIRRALEHPNPGVRQTAFAALAYSGKRQTVEESFRYFLQMDGKARAAWLRAARLRLGRDCVRYYRQLLETDLPPLIHQAVVKETLELPPEQAAEVLRSSWPTARGEFKAAIAGVLHAAGDTTGTLWLRERLRGSNPQEAKMALVQAARGDLELLLDDVLALSLHPAREVRLAVVAVIRKLPGENISNTLEVLAEDQDWEVRSQALRALTERGRHAQVDLLLEEAATATGTRLALILNLLTASSDPRAIPILLERYRKAPPTEARPFLRAMAYSGTVEGFDALAEIYLEDEVRINDPEEPQARTTWNYIPILMLNVRGAEDRAVALFEKLARDDYMRRARMLGCLVGMAADRDDPEVKRMLYDAVRRVAFDRSEIPQMRLLALDLLVRKALTIDDAMALKAQLAEEERPMQMAISDFLFEYF